MGVLTPVILNNKLSFILTIAGNGSKSTSTTGKPGKKGVGSLPSSSSLDAATSSDSSQMMSILQVN